MMNGSNYSLSDIAAATGSNNRANDMWGGDGFSLIWLVLIFAIFGWGGFGGWGGGFGGNGGNGANGAGFQGWATRADINESFALNDIQNGIRGIQQAINADTVAGMQNTNALQSQLANCCCETREAIQGINYNLATNTCALQNTMNNNTRDLLENQNSNTRAILDFLTNDKIATLQAENSDLKRAASQDRQSALLTTAMASQTQQLINAINPAAIPAYVVPNPNTYYGGCNGYSNGCC